MGISANLKKIFVALFMFVFASVFFVACGEDDNTIHVDSVVINHETYQLVVDKGFQIEASVQPIEATNQKIIYRSANTAIATVDTNGWVLGRGVGEVQIFATSDDGKLEANCLVTVVAEKTTHTSPTNLKYNSATNRLEWDESQEIANGVKPEYNLLIKKSGQQAEEVRVLTNYFSDIGANKKIVPGFEYTVQVQTLGNDFYYNDSGYTTAYTFTILASPANAPVVLKDSQTNNVYLSVDAVEGQAVANYQLQLNKIVNGLEESLPADDEALFNTTEYQSTYPEVHDNATKVRWLLPSGLSAGDYSAKVRILGDEGNNKFNSAFVTLGDNKITKLKSPTNLALTTGTGGVTVSWGMVRDATNYKIYLQTDSKTYESVPLNAQSTSCLLAAQYFNLEPGETFDLSNFNSYLVYMQTLGNSELYFIDSMVSAECATSTLDTPTGLNLTKGEGDRYTLSWNTVPNAEGYTVYVNNSEYTIGGTLAEKVFTSSSFNIGQNSIQVRATSTKNNVSNSARSSFYIVTKLSAPTLSTSGGLVSWASSGDGATAYSIRIKSNDEGGLVVEDNVEKTTAQSLNYQLGADFIAGSYDISITAIGNDGNVINSAESEPITFTKLGCPTEFRIVTENNTDYLKWANVDGATNYQIEIIRESTGISQQFTTTGLSYPVSTYMADFAYGDYSFKIRAYGSDSIAMTFLNSEFTDEIYAFRLSTPSGLSIENGNIVWNDLSQSLASFGISADMFSYELRIGSNKYTVTTNSYDTNTRTLNAGNQSVSIRAVVGSGSNMLNENTYLLSSSSSGNVTMYKLASPSNINLTDVGSLTWNTVTSNDDIEIGSYTVVFTYSNGNSYSYVATSNECPKSVVSSVPSAGLVSVRIVANGGSNYLNSQQSTSTTYSKLATPTLVVQYGELTWSYVKNDGKEVLNYKVYVRESGASSASSYDVSSNRWDMSVIPGGKTYFVSIQACGTVGSTRILNSEVSAETEVAKLVTPDATTIRAKDDLEGVTWNVTQTDLSFVYDIDITYITTTNEVKTMASASLNTNSYDFPDDTMWPGGTYQIKIRTKATGAQKVINSDYSNTATITRLATPTGLTVSNSVLTWNNVSNAYNYKANAVYGTASAVDISDLVVQDTRRIVLNSTLPSHEELSNFVGSITLSIKAIASSASSSDGMIYINSSTSLTKTVERYSAPEITITSDNKITFSTELASTRGNVLIFMQEDGSAATATRVTLPATQTTFDMDCSKTYDDDGTLTENVKYIVSIMALGDGQATLDSPESNPYANSVVKLVSPDYKIDESGHRVTGNWRVENGVLVWDTIKGAQSYRVEGYDDLDTHYDSGNITAETGKTTASCLPTIPEALGTITFTITANGGISTVDGINVQYITSQPTTVATVNKLGTPDDLRVEDGEIQWEARDRNGNRVVTSTVNVSGQNYTILSKYVVSYGQGETQDVTVNGNFILSDYCTQMAQVSVAVTAIGTTNSVGVAPSAVFLSSNSTYALSVTILDKPTELEVSDGLLTWTDQSENYTNFELILIGDTGYENKTIKLDSVSTDLADFAGAHYKEVYVRHYGSESSTYTNAYVNSPCSDKLFNVIKLPDITTYSIDENGDFTWDFSNEYTDEMKVGRTLALSVNGGAENIVDGLTYTLDTSDVLVTSHETFEISAYVQGLASSSTDGNNYINSNSFNLRTYKFAPVTSFMCENGLLLQWDLNDYSIIVDNKTVSNNKYIIEYQFAEFGSSFSGNWETVVVTGEKSWGFSKLGTYKLRISVASTDMNVLKSAIVDYVGGSNNVFSFNKFSNGEGTPENPFIIEDTTDGGEGGYYERSSAAEKLAYIFVISDKFFRLNDDIVLDDEIKTYDNYAQTFSYANTNIPYLSDDDANRAFTGGFDGAGHTISNFNIVLEDRTAMFKTIKGEYRTYKNAQGEEVLYDSNTCVQAGVSYYGRKGIVMGLNLEVSSITYNEAASLAFDDGIAFVSHYSYGGWLVNVHVSYTNEATTLLNLSKNETLIGGLVCYMSSFDPDNDVPTFLDARVVGCSSQIQWRTLSQQSSNCIRMGGLVAQNTAGLILASESRGLMQATTVGGIVYVNKQSELISGNTTYLGVISGCENMATLIGLPTGTDNGIVGGICATNESYVVFCKNSGGLTVTNYQKAMNASYCTEVGAYIGGICGSLANGTNARGYMFSCLNVGAITVSTDPNDYLTYYKVGGLFGTNALGEAYNVVSCLFDYTLSPDEDGTSFISAGGFGEPAIYNTELTTEQLQNPEYIVEEATESTPAKNIITYLNNTSALADIPNLNYVMGSVASLYLHNQGEYPKLDKHPAFS